MVQWLYMNNPFHLIKAPFVTNRDMDTGKYMLFAALIIFAAFITECSSWELWWTLPCISIKLLSFTSSQNFLQYVQRSGALLMTKSVDKEILQVSPVKVFNNATMSKPSFPVQKTLEHGIHFYLL